MVKKGIISVLSTLIGGVIDACVVGKISCDKVTEKQEM